VTSEITAILRGEVIGAVGKLLESKAINAGWLHNLPVLWMGLVVFGFTYLVTAGIYGAVMVSAVGERARAEQVH
jgi:hypothetical protein